MSTMNTKKKAKQAIKVENKAENELDKRLRKERKGKKTVALVGMAESTRDAAPWDDFDVEIWTLNESPSERFGYVKRVSRHFQLHPRWNFMRDTNQNDPKHPEWLCQDHKFPIYMQKKYDDIPASVRYPWEEIKAFWGLDKHSLYFTSTFPYMVALAIYEGFERIEIYGFEMGSDTEYAYQRGSACYWIGRAWERAEIYLPDNSLLLGMMKPLYGYDQVIEVNRMSLEIESRKMAKKVEGLKSEINNIAGQITQLAKDRNKPGVGKIKQKEIDEEGGKLNQVMFNKKDQLNFCAGWKEHCDGLIKQLDSQMPTIIKEDENKE